MPTYAYRCTQCGHAFDVQQSFTDDALTRCPQCEGLLRKVFSPVGVVFKGSGFYRNDARSTTKGSGRSGAPKETAGSTSGTSTTGSTASTSSPATSAPAAGGSSTSGSSTSGTTSTSTSKAATN